MENKNLLKLIGAISEQQFENTNWNPKTSYEPTIPLIPQFGGYILTHGSACLSLATTSAGLTYNGDWYVFRNDRGILDNDRYIVSASTSGLFVYKLKPQLIPYHHVTS